MCEGVSSLLKPIAPCLYPTRMNSKIWGAWEGLGGKDPMWLGPLGSAGLHPFLHLHNEVRVRSLDPVSFDDEGS